MEHQFVDLKVLENPLYGITEAARYIGVSVTTLRYWVRGERGSHPVIELPERKAPLLSFMNLVEAHILNGIRRDYRISLPNVRKTVAYLSQQLSSRHPLVEESLKTDGIDLFVERAGQLINLSQAGQFAMRGVLEAHLRRIEYEPRGIAVRLYPFTTTQRLRDPKIIVIDPRICFGKPFVQGTGILTSVVVERYKAGESIAELAHDYGLQEEQVEEAIRYEIPLAA